MKYIIIILGLTLLAACEEEGQTADFKSVVKKEVTSLNHDYSKKLKGILDGDLKPLDLGLGAVTRTEDCHVYLEPGGEVADPFPSLPKKNHTEDEILIETFLASCAPEAFSISEDFVYIAYGFPSNEGSNARDLRFTKYDRNSKALVWSFVMDRSENAKNYIANFRGSFLTFVNPDKVCVGTLWEGGTQTLCINDKSGEQVWAGRIPSWSGIKPVGGENGMYIAGLNSISKRYPFGGTEMSYKKLAGLGGRAAFYQASPEALYFSPSRSTGKIFLYRYAFDSFELEWKLELPSKLDASFGTLSKDVLVVRAKNTLVGISKKGKVLWQYDLGVGRPSITQEGGSIWLLHRRKGEPNILVKLETKSGKRLGQIDLPAGLLKVININGKVFLKGVRAVRLIGNK